MSKSEKRKRAEARSEPPGALADIHFPDNFSVSISGRAEQVGRRMKSWLLSCSTRKEHCGLLTLGGFPYCFLATTRTVCSDTLSSSPEPWWQHVWESMTSSSAENLGSMNLSAQTARALSPSSLSPSETAGLPWAVDHAAKAFDKQQSQAQPSSSNYKLHFTGA